VIYWQNVSGWEDGNRFVAQRTDNPTWLDAVQAIPVVRRIRGRAGLGEEVPVVGFCAAGLDEGAEVGVGFNVYMTWPDNFDQLRALLSRLIRKPPPLV
jgi:hypothetical protein